MDEFRKPFEYFEEQGIGGFLLVLFFMLITAEPLAGIMGIYFGFNSMNVFGVLGTVFQAAAVIYTVFPVLSAIALKKMLKFSVPLIKIFLVFRALFMVPYLYFNMGERIKAIPYQKGHALYEQMHSSIVSSFIIGVGYILLFSVLWYVYLLRSRRVRETFPGQTPQAGVKAQ